MVVNNDLFSCRAKRSCFVRPGQGSFKIEIFGDRHSGIRKLCVRQNHRGYFDDFRAV